MGNESHLLSEWSRQNNEKTLANKLIKSSWSMMMQAAIHSQNQILRPCYHAMYSQVVDNEQKVNACKVEQAQMIELDAVVLHDLNTVHTDGSPADVCDQKVAIRM